MCWELEEGTLEGTHPDMVILSTEEEKVEVGATIWTEGPPFFRLTNYGPSSWKREKKGRLSATSYTTWTYTLPKSMKAVDGGPRTEAERR